MRETLRLLIQNDFPEHLWLAEHTFACIHDFSALQGHLLALVRFRESQAVGDYLLGVGRPTSQ